MGEGIPFYYMEISFFKWFQAGYFMHYVATLKKKLWNCFKRRLFESGRTAVECRSVIRGDRASRPPVAVSKLGEFLSHHLACVFMKRHQKPAVLGVYARGSKRSHSWGKCVTCCGLTNSGEGKL